MGHNIPPEKMKEWFTDSEWDDTDSDEEVTVNQDGRIEIEKQPDPTHECTYCDTKVRIESEPRIRAPHFCEKCEQ